MLNKNLKNDLARIKTVIESDRKNVSCDVEKMLKYDLTCVLSGYFEKLTTPTIEIKSAKGGIKLYISTYAGSIRYSGVEINHS